MVVTRGWIALSFEKSKNTVKIRTVVFVILDIIICRSGLKIWVKTESMNYGEQIYLLGRSFRLFFIENEGNGMELKIWWWLGTYPYTFPPGVVVFGVFYIHPALLVKFHPGYIVCVPGIDLRGCTGQPDRRYVLWCYLSRSDDGYILALATMFPRRAVYAFSAW